MSDPINFTVVMPSPVFVGGVLIPPAVNPAAVAVLPAAPSISLGDEHEDTECFILFSKDAAGAFAPKTTSTLTFNSHTGVLTSPVFAGSLAGNAASASAAPWSGVTGKVVTRTLIISNPTAIASFPWARIDAAATLASIDVLCIGGTNVVGGLDIMGSTGALELSCHADVTAGAAVNATVDYGTSPGIGANHHLAAGKYLGWHTTGISALPSRLIVNVVLILD